MAETGGDGRRVVPQVAVGVVAIHDGRVLLIRRGKPPRADEWSIPGGRQEWGETVAEAALREVREETGLAVRLIGLIDVVDGIFRDPDGTLRFHYTLIDFVALAPHDRAVAASDAREIRWVAPQDLARYDLWSETRRIIARALEIAADHEGADHEGADHEGADHEGADPGGADPA